MVEVSVVMPCLDESESIGECIRQAKKGLGRAHAQGEIVIADNGSTDGSQDIARSLDARVIDVSRKGYGSALMGGFEAARGTYIIMGDADASYDFSSLTPFIERLRAGDDLVMGNRFKGGIKPSAMPFLNRYLGNPVLSFIGRLFFSSKIGDFHCGLRAFRRDMLPKLNLQSEGMEFASEMVVKATLNDLAISEVPTTLSPALRTRKPHLRPWRDGWRHLRFLLLFSPRWLFFYPGVALMLLGLGTTVALLPGQLDILGTSFDVHTMVYASALTVVGYQAILFAVFARTYAITVGFLPAKPWLNELLERVTLEVGVLAGALLILAGLLLSIIALLIWGGTGFSQLDYRETLRIVIPAGTMLILGVQTILASFFLSILGLTPSQTQRGC
ncbi:MAG TPA: glycosyltransferase family 2 protein [Solirubrobacterales bacterium]|nr:glycosyltransferase family 2 protein [Solirubrobacterales bacterium]